MPNLSSFTRRARHLARTAMVWQDSLLLKLVNVIAYISFTGSSLYNASKPKPFYTFRKETYLTPAPWVFGIWMIIHTLHLGTVIYQFFDNGKKTIIDVFSWKFPLLVASSTVYNNLWARGHYSLASSVALHVDSLAYDICLLKENRAAKNMHDMLWIQLLFSLWNGFTTVLWYITIFETFGLDARHDRAGFCTNLFVFLSLLSLVRAPSGRYSRRRDLARSVVVASSVWAIFDHQRSSAFVHWSACAWGSVAVFQIAKSFWAIIAGPAIFHLTLRRSSDQQST